MASLCLRRRNLFSLVLLLMFLLEMVFSVWAYDQQQRAFGSFGLLEKNMDLGWSERERVRYWRWKNRNRLRNRKARLGLQNKNQRSQKRAGGKMGKKNTQLPFEPYVYDVVESIESCCPTVAEIIEPVAGRNRTGHLVQLYQDEPVRQRFYEYSCQQGILNKPCKFLENRHSKQSKCTQQHTYTYALVRTHGAVATGEVSRWPLATAGEPHPWSLDYITIRSGCACQIVQNQKKRRRFSMDPGTL